jgi:hypothetical protein
MFFTGPTAGALIDRSAKTEPDQGHGIERGWPAISPHRLMGMAAACGAHQLFEDRSTAG